MTQKVVCDLRVAWLAADDCMPKTGRHIGSSFSSYMEEEERRETALPIMPPAI
jgi:hypothetical protein